MAERIADAFTPRCAFVFHTGHKQIQTRAIREQQHLPVVLYNLERVAKVAVWKRLHIFLQELPVGFAVLFRVRHQTPDQIWMQCQPKHINGQRHCGHTKLTRLQTIELVDAVIETRADLFDKAALRLPHL